jgi:hypothetical protein
MNKTYESDISLETCSRQLDEMRSKTLDMSSLRLRSSFALSSLFNIP